MSPVLRQRIISSVNTGWMEVHLFVIDESGIDLYVAN
jgi:hypothetical protein